MLKFPTDSSVDSLELYPMPSRERSDYLSSRPVCLNTLPVTNPDALPFLRHSKLKLLDQEPAPKEKFSLDTMPYPVLHIIFKHLLGRAEDYLAIAGTCRRLLQAISKSVLLNKKTLYFPFLQIIHEKSVFHFIDQILEKRGMDSAKFLQELNPSSPDDPEANRELLVHLTEKDVERGIAFIQKREYLKTLMNREYSVFEKLCCSLLYGLATLVCIGVVPMIFVMSGDIFISSHSQGDPLNLPEIFYAALFSVVATLLAIGLSLFVTAQLEECLPSTLAYKGNTKNLIIHQSKNPFLLFRQPRQQCLNEDKPEELLYQKARKTPSLLGGGYKQA